LGSKNGSKKAARANTGRAREGRRLSLAAQQIVNQEATEGRIPENAAGEARKTLERIFRRAARRR